ncbi:MAG: cob(I)alamin adenosyltransferase [Frankiaceae bacterium]|jgi:cob(I)alamin adenosyltransferase|nr:cob(I)alamin adenosyltransferase [Frankiaceae bacterium]
MAARGIRLTKIYTRTGDDGTTGLGGGGRVRKTSVRITAYADVDETNAAIGTAVALGGLPSEISAVLNGVQNDLFDVGADLSTPLPDAQTRLRVTAAYVDRLERHCDTFNEDLPALTSFVLPGGTAGAALLHVARTVCRRAERSAWALLEADPEATSTVPALYLNRLSDLLFILSRAANAGNDVLWRPGASDI